MAVLGAAQEWGVPPWVIAPDEPDPLLWLNRRAALNEQIASKNGQLAGSRFGPEWER